MRLLDYIWQPFFILYKIYILRSAKTEKFYVGTTDNFERIIDEHNSVVQKEAYTVKGKPWELFLLIEGLKSKQAYEIEKHIKSMKSSKYFFNLKRFPEIILKLKK